MAASWTLVTLLRPAPRRFSVRPCCSDEMAGGCLEQRKRKEADRHGKKHVCWKCKANANNREELIVHFQEKHNTFRRFCKTCGNGFENKKKAAIHTVECDGIKFLVDNVIVAIGEEAIRKFLEENDIDDDEGETSGVNVD